MSEAAPRAVNIGPVCLGAGNPLVLIAGPCVIESPEHTLRMAKAISEIAHSLGMPLLFKASCDKANRSSVQSYRGPGFSEGLQVLSSVRHDLAIPVITDIHTPLQAEAAGEAVDAVQIPAFLCRQTDLLCAAGTTGCPVNIKKGQFMAPLDMQNAIEKVESTGNRNVAITERGTFFGYNNLVSDMRSLPLIRSLNVPVVFDATHSVQLPGGLGNCSGGERAMASVLARAATVAGIDGLFLEVHDAPGDALCDGPNMIPLAELETLLQSVLAIDKALRNRE